VIRAWRLPHVFDAGPVRHTHHEEPSPSDGAAALRQRFEDAADNSLRTMGDSVHGLGDEACGDAVSSQLPQEEVGVARDAMLAHPWTGEEGHESIGLGHRGVITSVTSGENAPATSANSLCSW
jgi:hypothetical protein